MQREIRDMGVKLGGGSVPLTIDSHVQHPAFDNTVGIHCIYPNCSNKLLIMSDLMSYPTGLNVSQITMEQI